MPLSLCDVRGILAGRPRLLALFETVYAQVAGPDTAVLVGGSIARGEVDEFSDLDLVVVTRSRGVAERRRADLHALLTDRYEVLACFDAAHLGLACLDSIFVVVAGQVVKLDAAFWAAADGPVPVAGQLVHDGPGLAGALTVASTEAVGELERAPADIVGWTFHVTGLLGRGELFEAAYCLDQMRRRMLVPVLLRLAGLPQVNYRRIEARLPARWLDRLVATYPAALGREELLRSLRSLAETFAFAYRQLPPEAQAVDPEAAAASVSRMLDLAAS
jgi:Nucleotidyltransferase domain